MSSARQTVPEPAPRPCNGGQDQEEFTRRSERARLVTLRRDGVRDIGANLEEGAALTLAATTLAASFAQHRPQTTADRG